MGARGCRGQERHWRHPRRGITKFLIFSAIDAGDLFGQMARKSVFRRVLDSDFSPKKSLYSEIIIGAR